MKRRKSLNSLQHLLVDMDGVLWRGEKPMSGLAEFFDLLHQEHIAFVLTTNNASRQPDHYVQRLASYGIQISSENVITSAQATVSYLADRSTPGTPVYVIGEDGLRRTLIESGFRIVDTHLRPEYVIVSWDRQVTYEKLAQATLHIRAGAHFIATNPDRTWPSERGEIPGAGAILAAVQAATGVEPTVIGKPSPLMLHVAMRRMGADAETTAMLGDRLETDILGGHNAGVTTILVLSGVSTRSDLEGSALRPDLIFDDIAALTQAWRASLVRKAVP